MRTLSSTRRVATATMIEERGGGAARRRARAQPVAIRIQKAEIGRRQQAATPAPASGDSSASGSRGYRYLARRRSSPARSSPATPPKPPAYRAQAHHVALLFRSSTCITKVCVDVQTGGGSRFPGTGPACVHARRQLVKTTYGPFGFANFCPLCARKISKVYQLKVREALSSPPVFGSATNNVVGF